jgi:hypothetical protein
LCSNCRLKNYKECTYIPTVGAWKEVPMSMIKIKSASEKVPHIYLCINIFFLYLCLYIDIHIYKYTYIYIYTYIGRSFSDLYNQVLSGSVLMFVNPKDAYVRVKLLTKTRSPDSIHITHDYRLEENKKYSNISIADIVEPTHTMIADASIDRELYSIYYNRERSI